MQALSDEAAELREQLKTAESETQRLKHDSRTLREHLSAKAQRQEKQSLIAQLLKKQAELQRERTELITVQAQKDIDHALQVSELRA